jgi:hypothetical protein
VFNKMRRAFVYGSLAAAATLVASMPSAGTADRAAPRAAHEAGEHWDGVWRLTGQTRGVLRITQEGQSIVGRYTSGGGGNLTGQARGLSGEIITGRYKDDCCVTRRGTFKARLGSDYTSFTGTFDPTFSTSTYRWGGTRIR